MGSRLVAAAAVLLLLSGCASKDAEPERSSFLARAQQHIAAREYWASPTDAGLQAPNRRHDLRSWFDPTGVRVHDRTAGGSPRLVELRLTGVGRGDALAAVPPGDVTHREGRVEIRRAGLVEWFENSAQGLEQGFTLAEPAPAGDGDLVLEIGVTGARASRRGDAIALATDAGRTLMYGKLAVADVTGRKIAARFDVPAADRVRIRIDDEQAAYPLVIDPLLEGTADTLLQSDQSAASFGTSAASAGDVNGDGYGDVIVGAEGYDAGQSAEGAAFVFLGTPSGIPDAAVPSAHAQLESNQASASMGSSVASAGDVNGDGYADVIVGATGYDAGQLDEGAAFVFLGSAAGVADGTPASAHAQLESDQPGVVFGISVASAGDVNGDGFSDVIVGARLFAAGGGNTGGAFVFLGSPTGIASSSAFAADGELLSNQANTSLGTSVASAGDVNGDGFADVIVGASVYDAGQIDEGAAFIFQGNDSGRPILVRQRRVDGIGPAILPLGAAGHFTAFRVELIASHPAGVGRVRAQVEACPTAVAFGDVSCTTALHPAWVPLSGGNEEVLLST